MDRNSKGLGLPLAFVSTREAKRDSLFLLTALCLPDGQEICKLRVRNLSAKGLMADCPAAVERGQNVTLDLRGIGPVSGAIIWSDGGRVGIAFDRPINPANARMPATRSNRAMPDYLRPVRKIR